MALIVMSKVELRYRAVLAVQAGDRVNEVAHRLGVSRQSMHTWLNRYAEQGLAGLEDRSHRPESCSHQAEAVTYVGAPAVVVYAGVNARLCGRPMGFMTAPG